MLPKLTQQQQLQISKIETAVIAALLAAAPVFASNLVSGLTQTGIITSSVAGLLGLIAGTLFHSYKVNQANQPTIQNVTASQTPGV